MTDQTSGYLTVDERHLYTTLHRPRHRPAQGAVLMLAPFGEERKCGQPLMVDCARVLADAGLCVLRFDFSGTGESTGRLATARWDHWLREAAAAQRFLEHAAGTPRVFVVGFRLGGNLATQLPAETLAGRVLCEPWTAGAAGVEEMVRRKQIKEMYGGGNAASSTEDVETAWRQGGTVDLDGFEVNGAWIRAIRDLALPRDLQLQKPRPITTLVIHVTGAKRFTGAWQDIRAAVRDVPGSAFVTCREKPFWGRLDYAQPKSIIDAITGFCRP